MSQVTEVFRPLQADDPAEVAGYRIAARLGAGGMGVVYLSHTQGGRPVALKVVRRELADDPDFRRRFGREIKAARRVRGAYTAELIDADADGVPPWLATLYVPGPSLTEAVARRGPLPVPAVLWLMAGVAEALQAVHGAGIVHRDLKPSNVLLAADGPRVIDFGIALAADGTAYTATGGAIGTPSFMAPEQAVGDEVTAATDVFALGQTAAFAALGRPLYGEGSAINVLYRIVHSEPDLSLLPEPLRPLLARCLAADPAERPTPAEVVEWCRQRLGADADGGGAPAVWRDITGPEVAVPAPVPAPTVVAPRPSADHWQPPAGWRQPTPEERKARRRRTALITAVGVAGGALLVTALAWKIGDVQGGLGRLGAADSTKSAAGPTGRSSASSSGSEAGSPSGSEAGSSSGASDSSAREAAGDGTSEGSRPSSPATPEEPVATPYPSVWVDAKNSVNLKDPHEQLKNGKGEIRFGCEEVGCELKSDTAVFIQVAGGPGDGTFDTCRFLLAHTKAHTLPLAGSANGSEICVKDSDGNIGLLVIQTKSTAMPEVAFLRGEMTVWRNAA
ncbi:serine/threonine-protein kinase [Streptomyces sp. MJP52]|uniref:serine/threonine-protein kinase n=1 Tax=Streptomyces sp. MJP52 TaxID=2940555 RepID=UPI002476BBE6|nr:serine/threonine-protein kinase [Streptomyces sp. MJP52]MDH6224979.1 serine/threonine protein kinase [Streptomyces sp. MJP52]